MKKVLIAGAGEMASAVACRLVRCGFKVLMTELSQPLVVRRKVAFAEAVLSGTCTVEDVPGYLTSWETISDEGCGVRVIVDEVLNASQRWKPDVLVDGRMLKKEPRLSKEWAPLVIGLGPEIYAGTHCHAVVETNRGHNLGRVYEEGTAEANTGIPGDIASETYKRVVRAPCNGDFKSDLNIGDLVSNGQVIGFVDTTPVRAALKGVLRGQIAPGTPVTSGLKIGDVDPRGNRDACFSISDKARNISGSVLETIIRHFRGMI